MDDHFLRLASSSLRVLYKRQQLQLSIQRHIKVHFIHLVTFVLQKTSKQFLRVDRVCVKPFRTQLCPGTPSHTIHNWYEAYLQNLPVSLCYNIPAAAKCTPSFVNLNMEACCNEMCIKYSLFLWFTSSIWGRKSCLITSHILFLFHLQWLLNYRSLQEWYANYWQYEMFIYLPSCCKILIFQI